MKFTELKIENFLAITEAEFQLNDRGLVLIQGTNKSDTSAVSNGAGKSSIVDALCWCWFGTTARDVTGDDVVNNVAKKNCSVSSSIEDDGIIYTATRHRKHKTGKNTLQLSMYDGLKTTDLTKGTEKLTQEVANKIIGSSLQVFAGSIYAGQEKMPDLPAMTDKVLKLLIEEAAGITALEEAYLLARKSAQTADAAVDVVARNLDRIRTEKTRIEDEKFMTEQSDDQWHSAQKQKIADLRDDLVKRLGENKKLDAEITSRDLNTLNVQIATIDDKIASVKKEQDDLQQLQANAMKARMAKTRAATELANAQGAANRAKNAKDQAANKVGTPCNECGRPLTENEMQTVIDRATQTLKDALEQESTALKELEDAERVEKAAQDAMTQFQQSMTDVSAESAQRASLSASVREIEQLQATKDAQMNQILADKKRLDEMGQEKSPYAAMIETMKTKIKDLEDEEVVAQKQLDKHREDAEIEREVVKVFAPAGVRARILDEVTPYLNAQTSKYISIMSDGNITAEWSTLTKNAKGELKEKFTIDVLNAKGASIFKGLSGGEKRKVRVATALALQDLVATRASKPIDLFIGDEIDDALDAAGLERLVMILDEKAQERGTVLVISHNDLKDTIRAVIDIEKDAQGKTTVRETVV